MSTQERDGIPEWTPKIGIQCAILDLRENAIRLRDGSYSPQTIADDLEVIVNDLSKCFPVAQQEQPESWTRHPNPVHHIGPLSEEHLRDVVERTKAMQVALDAWVAQAQSGQTEVPCPLAFVEQTASVDAYVGAREDAAIWKKRALEAEELNRKFIAELNGPTYLGEPAQPAQKPDLWKTQFLTDVLTSAGLLRYGRTDKKLAQRIADGSARWRTELYTRPAPTQPALSETCINLYSPDDTATDWADKIRARNQITY